jgi:hypothetical protein
MAATYFATAIPPLHRIHANEKAGMSRYIIPGGAAGAQGFGFSLVFADGTIPRIWDDLFQSAGRLFGSSGLSST